MSECNDWLDRNVKDCDERELLKWRIREEVADNDYLRDGALDEIIIRQTELIKRDIRDKTQRVRELDKYIQRCLMYVAENPKDSNIKDYASRVLVRYNSQKR
jgi:hypothetical protein